MSAVAATAAIRTPRARTGLAAVLVASAASVLAYALQAMGLSGERPDNLVVYAIAFTGFAVAGWYAIRRFARAACFTRPPCCSAGWASRCSTG